MTDKIAIFENKKIRFVWVEAEGNQLATNCSQLEMPAEDGKMRLTDVASTEQLVEQAKKGTEIQCPS